MYHRSSSTYKAAIIPFTYLVVLSLCLFLAGCDTSSFSSAGNGTTNQKPSSQSTGTCLGNCTTGQGVQGVQVFVEPDAADRVITNAISSASKSVWLEIYLLTDRNVINSLEEAAHRGLDVRVMLETHPFGGGSPTQAMDQLQAAGAQVKAANPAFSLTHEKGMVIDNGTAYIMTANFTLSALGGSRATKNREYGIIDTNQQDVQGVVSIFNADWNRTTAKIDDPNLVVSPINSRQDFDTLINNAHKTLQIEAEEMFDTDVEQAIARAARRGVQVQVILPAPQGTDSNSQGIAVIKQGGAQVEKDPILYMHAKILIIDGRTAFVGSENISNASLDGNRELGIIVSDQNVLTTLQQTFQKDWSDSQAA